VCLIKDNPTSVLDQDRF